MNSKRVRLEDSSAAKDFRRNRAKLAGILGPVWRARLGKRLKWDVHQVLFVFPMKHRIFFLILCSILGVSICTYAISMLPPSSIVKESSTGLWVGWSLKFMLSEHEMMLFVFPDVDQERVIVSGDEPLRAHLEDLQNMTYKFDGSSIELLEPGAFFRGMHSYRNNEVSPVTAVFDLSWKLFAQKNGENDYLIDSGSNKGDAYQGAFFPEELPSAPSGGHVHWKFYFSDLDSVFKEHGDGWYLITMNGHLTYSFYSWSGNWTTEEIDYTFFTINCTYVDGAHTWMEIYYPIPLFVKPVQITHPILVGFKLHASTVVGAGATLSIISSGGYYYYSKKQKKPTQQNVTRHMHASNK